MVIVRYRFTPYQGLAISRKLNCFVQIGPRNRVKQIPFSCKVYITMELKKSMETNFIVSSVKGWLLLTWLAVRKKCLVVFMLCCSYSCGYSNHYVMKWSECLSCNSFICFNCPTHSFCFKNQTVLNRNSQEKSCCHPFTMYTLVLHGTNRAGYMFSLVYTSAIFN